MINQKLLGVFLWNLKLEVLSRSDLSFREKETKKEKMLVKTKWYPCCVRPVGVLARLVAATLPLQMYEGNSLAAYWNPPPIMSECDYSLCQRKRLKINWTPNLFFTMTMCFIIKCSLLHMFIKITLLEHRLPSRALSQQDWLEQLRELSLHPNKTRLMIVTYHPWMSLTLRLTSTGWVKYSWILKKINFKCEKKMKWLD